MEIFMETFVFLKPTAHTSLGARISSHSLREEIIIIHSPASHFFLIKKRGASSLLFEYRSSERELRARA
jgi:hypothetical protein